MTVFAIPDWPFMIQKGAVRVTVAFSGTYASIQLCHCSRRPLYFEYFENTYPFISFLFKANFAELSPNYREILLGIALTFSNLSGWLSPMVTAKLTSEGVRKIINS